MSRMFAVVSDEKRAPVFVKQGYVGFWTCPADQYVAWAYMHLAQGAEVTEAALRGSMVGWDNPKARPAVAWQEPESVDSAPRKSRPPEEELTRALSIRQPMYELILRGEKTDEIRSRRVNVRERVYLHAGKKMADFDRIPMEEAIRLPRGLIVGSVEIVGCRGVDDGFAWELTRPRRYQEPWIAHGAPQTGLWKPRF